MTDHDEQWLRDGLASAVPEPPTHPDRARAAEKLARRQRRTTSVAVLGAVGAVAATAVLATVLGSGGDGGRAEDRLASDPPAQVVECPPAEVGKDGVAEGVDEPDPGAPAAVPEGATSARLCQGPGTAFDFPEDALVTGVDDLVAAVNGLDETGEPEVCTMDLGPGYRIAFGYDDGSTFVISGQLYGCHTLVVGSGYRADPEAAQAMFLELLAAQQEEAGGGSPPDPGLECADAASASGADVAGLTAAVLCIDDGTGTTLSAPVDPADLEFLAGDMATNQSTAMLRCGAAPPFPTIVAVDGSGTVVAITSECATSFWRLPNAMAWMPSNQAVRILDQLVSEAR